MAIYTYRGCTIEVAKGGQKAKASVPGGESREFGVLGQVDAPTPQVQAQQWVTAMQMPGQSAKVHTNPHISIPSMESILPETDKPKAKGKK